MLRQPNLFLSITSWSFHVPHYPAFRDGVDPSAPYIQIPHGTLQNFWNDRYEIVIAIALYSKSWFYLFTEFIQSIPILEWLHHVLDRFKTERQPYCIAGITATSAQ